MSHRHPEYVGGPLDGQSVQLAGMGQLAASTVHPFAVPVAIVRPDGVYRATLIPGGVDFTWEGANDG